LGETALPPIPAAIGNALFSRGIHLTALPMTAERVLTAIDRRATDATDASVGDGRLQDIRGLAAAAPPRADKP
jgi:hypothetical protein